MAVQETLHVGKDVTLDITASTPAPIQFDGTSGTLRIEPGIVLTGPLMGFVATDRIDFAGKQLTSLQVTVDGWTTTFAVGDAAGAVNTFTFQGPAMPALSLQDDLQGGIWLVGTALARAVIPATSIGNFIGSSNGAPAGLGQSIGSLMAQLLGSLKLA
jgi:hypothetical protein